MEFKKVVTRIEQAEITMRIPADPEAVLSEAVALVTDGEGVSDPYWCLIWDAAPKTSAAILRHDWSGSGVGSSLEIGCGVGMAGIAARIAGLPVTVSDYSPQAVEQALLNAKENGFEDIVGEVIDWNAPPDTRYDFIFGSDVLYERRNHQPVLNVLDQMLAEDGIAWLGDMGRQALPHFVELSRDKWQVEIEDADGKPVPKVLAQQFQLLKMTRR